MLVGSVMAITNNFNSSYPLKVGGTTVIVYAALAALIINVVVAAVLTPIFVQTGARRGADNIAPADFLEGASALPGVV